MDEVKKVDWQKLEQQLRLSYEQINWSNLQDKINTSLAQIKIDSIHQALTLNLKELNLLEKAMKENNIVAIPDTDIRLDVIHENQKKAEDQLEKIKAAKAKKIVRL